MQKNIVLPNEEVLDVIFTGVEPDFILKSDFYPRLKKGLANKEFSIGEIERIIRAEAEAYLEKNQLSESIGSWINHVVLDIISELRKLLIIS